jgi:hypothetical protein
MHGSGGPTFAKMIELRVEVQFRRLAPPLLGGGSTYFRKKDLQAAFPNSKAGDTSIAFGDTTVLADSPAHPAGRR